MTAAAGWRELAPTLAAWTWAHLVNRTDVWGAYGRDGVWTAPARAVRGHRFLTVESIARHYLGASREDVMGLHTTGPEQTSRWGAIDVDCHDDDPARAARLWREAQQLADAMRRRALFVLVEDSNGAGSFHLWTIFDAPAPTRDVHALLVAVQAEVGTAHENYPKQADTGGAPGNWLRLFGRHHTRPHWSRIFDGARWLEGADAARALLAAPLTPAAAVPVAPADAPALAPMAWQPPPVPASGDAVDRRITAYVARLPWGMTAGDGRNRVAFHLALFLVVACEVSDDRALAELAAWNRGNRPPIGAGKLAETVANAHRYNGRYAARVASRPEPARSPLAVAPTPAGWAARALRAQPTAPPGRWWESACP